MWLCSDTRWLCCSIYNYAIIGGVHWQIIRAPTSCVCWINIAFVLSWRHRIQCGESTFFFWFVFVAWLIKFCIWWFCDFVCLAWSRWFTHTCSDEIVLQVTLIAHGDVPLSIIMTMCTTIASVLVTPLLTKYLAGTYVPIDAVKLSISTLQVMLDLI